MKRTIAIITALVFALTLVSCGEKGPNPDNWHNNSGINQYLAINFNGENTNAACVFGENGIEMYFNDSVEKVLLCKVEYSVTDTNPEATAESAAVDDVDGDGYDDLLILISTSDGKKSTVFYWSEDSKTFEERN